MAYENNHFVPRLVLRRYGNKLNYFDIKNSTFKTGRRIEDVFSFKNLYPLDLELRLKDIESRFGDLLNNKILNADKELVLTRKELTLIKKFLIIEMFRVPDALVEHPNAKDSKEFSKGLYGFEEKIVEGETFEEYIFRTIRSILDSDDLESYYNNPDKTYEGFKWFKLVSSCYLTFWDSKESKEDFIITDRGLTCEHEKTRFEFEKFGFKEELIKEGFMLSKLFSPNTLTEKQKQEYFYLGELSRFVYANYYMFSISETRMIGLINPWYRLWGDSNKIKLFGGTPDVYPCMLSKEAMQVNRNEYVDKYIKDGVEQFTPNDLDKYIYDIKNLSFEDVCIINCMMLDRTYEFMGYVDSNKILRSLMVYNNLRVKLNDFKALQRELESLGYTFPNPKRYYDLINRITLISFTPAEQKYIDFMFDFRNKLKNGKI